MFCTVLNHVLILRKSSAKLRNDKCSRAQYNIAQYLEVYRGIWEAGDVSL